MKRCPQCLFLYPESDERCDFDQTPLELINDAEIDAATRRPRKSRTLLIAAAVGLILGVLIVGFYYGISRHMRQAVIDSEETIKRVPESAAPVELPSPSPSPSPTASPSPSPSPSPRTAQTTLSAAHSRATSDPVSTSGPGIGSRQGTKPIIILSAGGKIEADEVWKTKDGVWYRRNGIVTLLKRGQVKTISMR